MLKRRRVQWPLPEENTQRAVLDHLRRRGAPGVFCLPRSNGGYRWPLEAAIMKGQGVLSGVPDVIAVKNGRAYGLELKMPDGRISETQRDTMAAMTAAGATVAVAYGIDQAIRQLEAWELLRGRAAIP
jgi:hypothetical protein